MCGGFFLKFSNTKVNSEDRITLTHNEWVYGALHHKTKIEKQILKLWIN